MLRLVFFTVFASLFVSNYAYFFNSNYDPGTQRILHNFCHSFCKGRTQYLQSNTWLIPSGPTTPLMCSICRGYKPHLGIFPLFGANYFPFLTPSPSSASSEQTISPEPSTSTTKSESATTTRTTTAEPAEEQSTTAAPAEQKTTAAPAEEQKTTAAPAEEQKTTTAAPTEEQKTTTAVPAAGSDTKPAETA